MRKAQLTIHFTKQPYINDVGPRRIINFSTLSGNEVLKAGEVEGFVGGYYDINKNPIENGLLDPHMGTIKCSRVLLAEEDRVDYLRKMKNPKAEPLKKSEILKNIVKKCNGMTTSTKRAKCSRCGYENVYWVSNCGLHLTRSS
ncbi:hypothetical protein OROMI_006429 [Orobanche minor]